MFLVSLTYVINVAATVLIFCCICVAVLLLTIVHCTFVPLTQNFLQVINFDGGICVFCSLGSGNSVFLRLENCIGDACIFCGKCM